MAHTHIYVYDLTFLSTFASRLKSSTHKWSVRLKRAILSKNFPWICYGWMQ